MELLLIAALVTLFKVVQDGRTDRAYADKGMVSPRHQVRLAKLEAAGRPPSAPSNGPLRNYVAEVYADTVNDMGEKRRARRAARAPFDPASPSVGQRAKAAAAKAADGFDARALRVIDGWKQSKGWDTAKATGRKFMGPAGEKPAEAPPAAVPAATEDVPDWSAIKYESGVHYTPPKIGQRYDDMEWVGDVWAPVCSRCDKPMGGRDAWGWLICDGCGLRAADRHNPPADNRIVEQQKNRPDTTEPTNTPSTGGTMTAPTGEAVNYETTVSELEALSREQRGHIDHCQQALKSLEQAKASINNMQESYRQSSAAAAATSEHLAAKNLDGTTLAHAGTTADAMPAGKVDQMYDQLEGMEAEAKARLADAEVALGSTEANLAHVQATYSTAHETVAGQLGGDSSFLNSGGGVSSGVLQPSGSAAGASGERAPAATVKVG